MIKEIYEDAIFLKENGKPKGCLLLLLCLIDALAKNAYPTASSNKERYCNYLSDKLKQKDLDTSYRIEEQDQLVHFSEIIYNYFRCYFVHEADDRTNCTYEVQMEFETPGRFKFDGLTLMDRPNEKFIVRSDKLIELLLEIIQADPTINL